MLTRLPWFLRHMVVNLTGWECPMTLECRHICSRGTLARLSLVRTLTMDGWIKTAWRAFWVGLGASAVLVSQAVLAPSHPAAPAPDAPALVRLDGVIINYCQLDRSIDYVARRMLDLRDRRERHPLQLIAGPRTSTSNARDLAH